MNRALRGLPGLYVRKAELVPRNEMVASLHFKVKIIQPKLNQYVRVKRGLYAGDLAKVVDVMGDKVKIRIIPRIDYLAMEKAARDKRDGIQTKSRFGAVSSKIRPAAKLFSKDDVAR